MKDKLNQLEKALLESDLPPHKRMEILAILAELRQDDKLIHPDQTGILSQRLLEFESRHPEFSGTIGRLSSLLAGSGL
ncbi:MAG: hypothetical protein RL095_1060 [Verrucomicrobiota bacterium]|jgi:hypothetical protein